MTLQRLKNLTLIIALSVQLILLEGCSKPSPVKVVQTYLRMLSGEIKVSEKILNNITTENFRAEHHPEIISKATLHREWIIDRAEEIRKDPAIKELLKLITWTTTYEIKTIDSTSSRIVARVILVETRAGNRKRALAIKGLPKPLYDILQRGLELPFQFQLVLVDGRWKIDKCIIPEQLLPLFE